MESLSFKRKRYLPKNFVDIQLQYYAITTKVTFERFAQEMSRLRDAFLVNNDRKENIEEIVWNTFDDDELQNEKAAFCQKLVECNMNVALQNIDCLSVHDYNALCNQMLMDQPFFAFFDKQHNNISWSGLYHNHFEFSKFSWSLFGGFNSNYGVQRSTIRADQSICIREVCVIVASDYEAMCSMEKSREILELFRQQYVNDIVQILGAWFTNYNVTLSPNKNEIVFSTEINSMNFNIACLLKD